LKKWDAKPPALLSEYLEVAGLPTAEKSNY